MKRGKLSEISPPDRLTERGEFEAEIANGAVFTFNLEAEKRFNLDFHEAFQTEKGLEIIPAQALPS